MKKLISIFIICFFALPAFSQITNLPNGIMTTSGFRFERKSHNYSYRGTIETNYNLHVGRQEWDFKEYPTQYGIDIRTAHGVQFNPYLFIGLETGVAIFFTYHKTDSDFDKKYEIRKKEIMLGAININATYPSIKLKPFLCLKIGYPYLPSLNVGARVFQFNNCNVLLSAGIHNLLDNYANEHLWDYYFEDNSRHLFISFNLALEFGKKINQ